MKVVDFHCDTLSELRYAMNRGEYIDFGKNELQIDLEKLKKGDYLLQCFALFNNLGRPGDPLVGALEQIDRLNELLEKYPDDIAQVKKYEDIEKNRAAGKISALLTIEEGQCCKADAAVLRVLYSLGVRIMTLTWNLENDLAWPNIVPDDPYAVYPCAPTLDKGVKEKGYEIIKEAERLGIILDVSHLSDKGFWDIYNNTTRPFIASHSNVRALCPHVRNLTDEMIKAISERGGVTGINYCASFLDPHVPGKEPVSTAALMADHIDYIRNVGGLDMISLGSDFDGIEGNLELYDASCMPILERELSKRGYSDDDIEAIFSKNALRVLKEFL